MSEIVAIGEGERLRGFALAGVDVVVAADPADARAAWDALSADAALVILTPAAHAALGVDALSQQTQRLWVVLGQ